MVEFVLEEGIRSVVFITIKPCTSLMAQPPVCVYSDAEAVKLILKEPPKRSGKELWRETQYGSILSLCRIITTLNKKFSLTFSHRYSVTQTERDYGWR